VPKPAGFDAVERAGAAWLAAHPTGRPPDKWSKFRSHLADGFHDLCGYSAMYDAVGTIDHFVSCDEDRTRAYDWSNYRYIAGWLNSSKQDLRSTDVLDPFTVGDDWFEISLPSLQLEMTEAVPVEKRPQAKAMLERLHLRDGERVIRQRQVWYRRYQSGRLPSTCSPSSRRSSPARSRSSRRPPVRLPLVPHRRGSQMPDRALAANSVGQMGSCYWSFPRCCRNRRPSGSPRSPTQPGSAVAADELGRPAA
jgi:hypothetical protein